MLDEHKAVIYPTMWRPPMLKGIPRDWTVFSGLVATGAMVIVGWLGMRWYQFVGIGVFIAMAAAGWLAAKFDPDFFSVFLTQVFKIGRTRGRHKGNFYVA